MAIFGDDTLHHCVLWKKVSTEMFHAKISSSRAGWTELNWIGIPWSGRNGPKVDGGIKWEGNIDLISCHKLLLRFRFDFIIISILYSKEVILSSSGGGEVSGPLWIVWFKYLLLVCVEKWNYENDDNVTSHFLSSQSLIQLSLEVNEGRTKYG